MSFWRTKVDPFKVGELLSILVCRRAIVDTMSFRRTKFNPLKVVELLLFLWYRRTKVDPLKVGELLSILQCIRELLLILWVSGELRPIPSK